MLRAVSAKAPFALEKSASDSETNDDENKSDTTGGGGLFVALVRKLIVRGSRERDECCRLEVFAALEAALSEPKRPVVAVVGGAKVSTKLDLLANLVEKVDHLVIGGGMANTFLAAQGFEIGTSLAERDMLETAKDVLAKAVQQQCQIILPVDVIVARAFEANAENNLHHAQDCPSDAMILDAGPATVKLITDTLMAAETLIWNGPLGAFELEPFDAATVAAARAAASLTKDGQLISVAGGGDTVAALNAAGVAGDFTYISTAGGAFLEWMEGKTLPGVAALG